MRHKRILFFGIILGIIGLFCCPMSASSPNSSFSLTFQRSQTAFAPKTPVSSPDLYASSSNFAKNAPLTVNQPIPPTLDATPKMSAEEYELFEYDYEKNNQELKKYEYYYVYGSYTQSEAFSVYWETCNDSVGIDFYLMDTTNFNKFKNNQSSVAYYITKNYHTKYLEGNIPYTGTWYFIFYNIIWNKTMNLDLAIDSGPMSFPEFSEDDGDFYGNDLIAEPQEYYYETLSYSNGDQLLGYIDTYFQDDGLIVAIMEMASFRSFQEHPELNYGGQNFIQQGEFGFKFKDSRDYMLVIYNDSPETVTFSYYYSVNHSPMYYLLPVIIVVAVLVVIGIAITVARRKRLAPSQPRITPVAPTPVFSGPAVPPSNASFSPRDRLPPSSPVEMTRPPTVESPKPAILEAPPVPSIPEVTIPIIPETPLPEGMHCSGCGTLLQPGYFICTACGTMNSPPITAPQDPSSPEIPPSLPVIDAPTQTPPSIPPSTTTLTPSETVSVSAQVPIPAPPPTPTPAPVIEQPFSEPDSSISPVPKPVIKQPVPLKEISLAPFPEQIGRAHV